MNIRAKQNLAGLENARTKRLREVEAAQADVESARVSEAAGAQGAIGAAMTRLGEAKTRLQNVERELATARAGLLETQRNLAGEAGVRQNDRSAQIERKYNGADGLITLARKQASAEEVVNGVLTRRIALLDAARRAELEKLREAGREEKREKTSQPLTDFRSPIAGGRVSGTYKEARPGYQHQGMDYAVPVGTPVRAPAAGVVDVAGQRQGYGNAIYINFGGGTTGRFGHLSQLKVKPGDRVEAGDVIGLSGGEKGAEGSGRSTGPHLHYEVRRGGRSVDPRIGRFPTDPGGIGPKSGNGVDQEEARQNRSDYTYEILLMRVKGQRLQLERDRILPIEQAAALERAAVTLEEQKITEAVNLNVKNKVFNAEKGRGLIAEAQINTALANQVIDQRERSRLLAQQLETDRAEIRNRVTLLQLQGQLAVTARQRRDVALRILAQEEDERRRVAQRVIDDPRSTDQQRLLARGDLAAIGREAPLRRDIAMRQTQDPLQAYGQRLIDQTSSWDEALKGVKANGLQSVEDGLVAIVSGTQSVGQAFQRMSSLIIADLARIAIRKAIVGALGRSFFGLADGGAVDDVPGYADGGIPFLDRGIIRGPGTGRSDSILALVGGTKPIRVSNGEALVNARGVRNYWPLIDAINRDTLPRFADGGLPTPAMMVPKLPTAQQLGGAPAAMPPIQITLRTRRGEAFETEVLAVSVPASVRVLEESMPTIADASAATTLARLSTPRF